MRTEINVMSSGSCEPALDYVAAAFQKETGCAVTITYNLGARGIQSLEAGEFDVVIASGDSIERNFRPAGLVEDGGVSIGRMGIGVMVRPGAPVPDISSVDALRRSILEAESLLITTHTSGLETEAMLKKLGIFDQANAKASRFPDGPSLLERLLAGSGREIAILSINHIGGFKDSGLVIVGPLPDEVQRYRDFIAVASSRSPDRETARQFVRYCGGPGKAVFSANGFN
jgi:molybdate transport system substrate-binding protein